MTATFTEIMKDWQDYLNSHPEIAEYFEKVYNSYFEKAKRERLYLIDGEPTDATTYTFSFLRDE